VARTSVDLVSIEGLTVAYPARTALEDVDLAIPPATSVAVIGPNGSGKSTLLGVIAGLVSPTSGRVAVDRSQVSLVLQSTEIDATLPLTVREAVRMARYPHRGMFGRFRAEDHAAVDAAMARTEVADLADRQLRELSGGQRQRALVAQGLAQEAPLLLLDEPVTGLDIVSRDVILGIVDQERDAGHSVVMTTHSLEEAARCDVVVLLAGRVVAAGPPEDVIVDEHLEAAFGGRALRLPSGRLLFDDPHHAHHHDDHHADHH
jgi:ABC-type Mn2+/Zn2+ transport system ATPase subunit